MDYNEDHKRACQRGLDFLQGQLNEGNIPEGGIVAAYVTVVETVKADGGSGLYLLWSDGRTTILTGLLAVGSTMVVTSTMGSPDN